ncbi:phosphatase PAP2 family protein [Fibrisoma montanum]|uniref:Phosphatase PAP2 family protein n=1 Tax=Fibrisoma montanum TaxID=2305895 RepID=A0A418M3Q1_9BACT|nr:phosphatase PAP2-related protein [Fibrisoma montanum]RIV20447.1 phosphatase PAP2 family protein [Fibrisoma montanum]
MGVLHPEPNEDIAWRVAWQSAVFRRKVVIGIVALVLLLIAFPFFFQAIEQHTGPVLNDWVLSQLPARDMSLPIFLLIWSTGVLLLVRVRRDPAMFMTFVYSYLIVSLSRMVSISLVPLNPPVGLLPLIDPISNAFYGRTFITKDLFYSGHTSTIFLMFLCLRRRWDRLFALAGSFVVGLLLLIQHVHYTVDVVAAPLLTYLFFRLAKRIALSGWNNTAPVKSPESSATTE